MFWDIRSAVIFHRFVREFALMGGLVTLIPVIPLVKNFKTRCEGLSPSLFIFTAFGSCTYVLSILAKSLEKEYLITNAGWLAGHGLSCFLDFAVRTSGYPERA
jgi:hypothetical protein